MFTLLKIFNLLFSRQVRITSSNVTTDSGNSLGRCRKACSHTKADSLSHQYSHWPGWFPTDSLKLGLT